MSAEQMQARILTVLQKRAENGGVHLHHRECIHNLPPEEQVEVRGKTVDWWLRLVGPLPVQIGPEDWQTKPPVWPTEDQEKQP